MRREQLIMVGALLIFLAWWLYHQRRCNRGCQMFANSLLRFGLSDLSAGLF